MPEGSYFKDEEFFNKHRSEVDKNFSGITLPPEWARLIQEDTLHFTIRLARFKFIARLVKPDDKILEIGCGSGVGTIFVGQHCTSIKGIDIVSSEISYAKELNRRDNVSFESTDFLQYPEKNKYNVVYSLDVIEHMPEAVGRRFVEKTCRHLTDDGMLVIGTPSCYSYEYESESARAGHVKMYDQKELVAMVENFYGRVIAFSMNDEIVHTGFHKLAWYYIILAFMPKRGNAG
jgi:2-polyprenyl-3-methyl-5-hydroxy-6-metoxy-1,4-benzoquinol methylase